MSGEMCPELVWSSRDVWSAVVRKPCGKPVKRNGLCGVHARSADLSKAKHDEYEARDRQRVLAIQTAKKLTAELHIHFYAVNEHVAMNVEVAADVLRLGLLRSEVSLMAPMPPIPERF